ncbi:hypothetical protein WA026_011791 [Henosepilachna vigintioctopunctata]|uniref:Uncharacterized protein n=1 Tax=Henosepilachna vigintioctopunctata TaxID=420089 RepID=A0AAW1UDE5_9CUCU
MKYEVNIISKLKSLKNLNEIERTDVEDCTNTGEIRSEYYFKVEESEEFERNRKTAVDCTNPDDIRSEYYFKVEVTSRVNLDFAKTGTNKFYSSFGNRSETKLSFQESLYG